MKLRRILLGVLAALASASALAQVPQLSKEQVAKFKAGLQDPHIQVLKYVIAKCRDSKLKGDACEAFVRNHVPVADLQGKFLVYWVENPYVSGGVGISIIFVNNPKKLYNAVVTPINNPHRVRDFFDPKLPEEKMQAIEKQIAPLLANDELTL